MRSKSSDKVKQRKVITEMRKKRGEISVEIMNISKHICVFDKRNVEIELNPEESEILTLDEVAILNNNSKLMKNYNIIVLDVLDEDYDIDDVLNYLQLNKYYEDYMKDGNDFVETIMYDYDIDEFKDVIYGDNYKLAKLVGSRMYVAYKDKQQRGEIDKDKIKMVGRRFRLTDLLEEIILDDFNDYDE